MRKFALWLSYYLCPLIPILALYQADPARYGTLAGALPMILGCTAFSWLSLQFVLSGRPKFVDRVFGLDRVYRFHGLMAVFALSIAVIHKLLEYEGTFATTLGEIALYCFIGVSVFTILFMVDSVISGLSMVKKLRELFRPIRLFKYENYRLLHNLTFFSYLLIFVHVLLSGSARQHMAPRLVYIGFFLVAIFFFLRNKKTMYAPGGKHIYEVNELRKESDSIWTVVMGPREGRVLVHRPGQFAFFRFKGKNLQGDEHPFSISSGGMDEKNLTITVKALGDFTRQIPKLEPGDQVVVGGPFGKFSYTNHPTEKELMLVAGGVGITPMLSMLRHMVMAAPERKVTLIWGVRASSDLFCLEELNGMKERMPGLQMLPVVSDEKDWPGLKGYVTTELVLELMKEHGFDHGTTGIYVCGPPVMMDAIIKGLRDHDMRKGNIHFERFSL